jgi:hypothetical protein
MDQTTSVNGNPRSSEQVAKGLTAAEVDIRINHVMQLLLDGRTKASIREECQKQWSISGEQSDRYHQYAKRRLEALNARNLEATMARNLHRLSDLYHRAVQNGDLKVAIDVIKTEARLLGMNAPDRLEQDISITDFANMTPEQRSDRLMRIVRDAKNRKSAGVGSSSSSDGDDDDDTDGDDDVGIPKAGVDDAGRQAAMLELN